MIALKSFDHEVISSQIVQTWNKGVCTQTHYKIDTDSRSYIGGNAFLAIRGEKYDAFKLLAPLLKSIPLVVFEATIENLALAETFANEYTKTYFIAVKNSVSYLQELASIHVRDWYEHSKTHYLIAISGSNGKTTTKEMLYHLLKNILGNEVIATQKNNNNHIGVPLTIFDIHPQITKASVVEFGSNHPGEMKVLCDLAHPNVGITTNIGHTHMEFFEDLKDVYLEEALIYHAVMKETKNSGLFLINADDIFLKTLKCESNSKIFSSEDRSADAFYEYTVNGVKIDLKNMGQFILSNDHVTGRHNFLNLANAFTLAVSLFPQFRVELQAAASTFMPTPNRSQWIQYAGKDIFLDAYNANPSSMKAALLGFLEMAQNLGLKKSELLVVIGEMKELGIKSSSYHAEFAAWIKGLELQHIIYVGNYHDEVLSACSHMRVFDNVEKAKDTFQKMLENSQKCFIKASRSLQLERLVGITKG